MPSDSNVSLEDAVMEQMVGLGGGAILALISFIIGMLGIVWAGTYKEVVINPAHLRLLDSLSSTYEQINILNYSLNENFETTFDFLE
jgi:hypothetical protein